MPRHLRKCCAIRLLWQGTELHVESARQDQDRSVGRAGGRNASVSVFGTGPNCIAKTPGVAPSVTLEEPSAMPKPTCSWRQMIGFGPTSAQASMSALVRK